MDKFEYKTVFTDATGVFGLGGKVDQITFQNELNELAAVLRQYQMQGQTSVVITGHTDYKGDDAYNMNLSLLRAQTVRNYLINQGVDPNSILATGAGESQPVKQCATNLSRQQEIDCLQPNRRVSLDITVIK